MIRHTLPVVVDPVWIEPDQHAGAFFHGPRLAPPSPIPIRPRWVSIITTFDDWLTIGWPCLPFASPGFE
jgi:hypothetical protein